MNANLGFRVGTSSRRVTRYHIPRRSGPHYVVLKATDKCLVLEDLLPRQLRFRSWLRSTAKIVNTAPKAIEALRREHFDVVFLDRDLGIGAGHGEDVAAELVRLRLTNCRVVCHSTNSFGAALIEKTLKDGGISKVEVAPFDILGVLRESAE
jgi:hypothetical protein